MTARATSELDTVDGQARLYETEHLGLVRLARLITGSQEMAEDAVHDAFVAVFRQGGPIERPGAYLRQAVVNNCLGARRRREVERLKLKTIALDQADQIDLPPELDEMWRALSILSKRQRAALVLRYYDDLTVDGIAEVMAEKPGTVKSRLHRGLKRLEQEVSR